MSKYLNNPFRFSLTCLVSALSFFSFFSLFNFGQVDTTAESIEESIFQSSQNLHQWGAINSFHGLPSEKVNAIAQTSNGFLWFGTHNGLAKFDGRRVQTSLSSTAIYDVKTDSDDMLWIATDRGAFHYENGSFIQVKETSDYSINSILIDDGYIYLTEGNGTIFRCTRSERKIKVEILLKKSIPIRAIEKFDGASLVGTFNSGLQKLTDNDLEEVATRPRPFFINVLRKDSEDNLWLGARSSAGSSGLFVSEKMPVLKVVGENLGTVNALAFGSGETTWVGTEARGAYLFESKEFRKRFTFENTSGGLRSNKVLAVFVDREGVVWFGTDKGVSRYDPRSLQNERISDDVQSNFVRSIFESSEGSVFAGTNRGLFVFDETSKIWKAVSGFEKDTIYSISELGSDNLLVGTQNGFFSKERRKDSADSPSTLSEKTTRSITEFKGKVYFAAFDLGLRTIEGDTEKLIFDSTVISLHKDGERLWIGTVNQGAVVFDGNNTTTNPLLAPLKETVVRSIAGNEKDGMWFATDKGLYLLSESKLEHILPGVEARAVELKRDSSNALRIWCATSAGLYSFLFDENFGWLSSHLDIEQGLSSQNTFAISYLERGTILIGTSRGIVRYEPTDKSPTLIPNRIVSQRVHSASELKSGIDLDFPQNSLSIDVTATSSRTFPEQFQYSFLLFNSKNELIDKRFGSESQFVMENLDPDEYRVEVRAFDGNLVSSDPLAFNLKVEDAPFPWIATILGVLLLIALAALIWAILSQQKIFRTSKQLAHANKELNSARLDLANEAERERHRISRDLHDQTLADLRHLLLMADEVSTDKAPEFRSEIESVSDEIRRICEDLSPSVLENIGFAASLEWALGNAIEQIGQEHEVTTEFISKDNLEESLTLNRAEQIQVYRIAQEILSNVVRHSKASEIRMSANSSKETGFVLTVENDGKTFDPKTAKKGRGLSNIRARASLINAEVDWREVGGKMIFTLTKESEDSHSDQTV